MIQIDMDMPKNCRTCPMVRVSLESWCVLHDGFPEHVTDFNKRPSWCPLRPVVTCGECRYNPKIANGDDYYECICTCWDSYYSIEPEDEWFCWKGKKKCDS